MIAKRPFFTFFCAGLVAIVGCKARVDQARVLDADDTNAVAAGGADASQPTFADAAPMDIELLRQAAYKRCQAPTFVKPNPPAIPDLDPPQFNSHGVEVHHLATGEVATEDATGNYPAGSVKGPGIDYSEEGLIQTSHDLHSDLDFFFRSRPRAALNPLPVQLFLQKAGSPSYERVTWEMANFDYSNPGIDAKIDASKLPEAGKILTKLLVGHKSPTGGWPQIFDYGSTGYLRFQGYSQVPGASFRTAGSHNVFGKEFLNPTTNQPTGDEDFGLLEALFFSVKDGQTTSVLALIESDLFCGALDLKLTPGEESVVDVDSFWYTRRDFKWQEEPNTGFVSYSSMFFHGVAPAADGHHDEHTDAAHDSDTLIVTYKDNTSIVTPIKVPTSTQVYNAPGPGIGTFVVGLTPAFTAGHFKAGQTVEIWSGVASGEPRTSDGTTTSWKVVGTNAAVGTISLQGNKTGASTITGNDFMFVKGERLFVKDVTDQNGNKEVRRFLFENVDRNPVNYTYYQLALKTSSYQYRASYGVEILDSNVKTGVRLVEHIPNKEYLDNLVAFSCLRQDISASKSAEDFSHFHYKTWSCYPGSPSCPSPDQIGH